MKLRFSNSSDLYVDAIIVLLLTLVIFAGFRFLDAFEEIYNLTRRQENWELDEYILLLLSLPFPVSWFAYRRARVAAIEVGKRHELEKSAFPFPQA